MLSGVRSIPVGEALAPNLFAIDACPDQAEILAGSPALIDGLVMILQEQGEEAGLKFASPLAVQVFAAEDLPANKLRVHARHSLAEVSKTASMEITHQDKTGPDQPPANAFLIVDGTQTFPLTQSVVNIGRRPDNHLVVNDERVSRIHAQLRLVRSSYFIFDLDSKGGTYVNGQRIHHFQLQAGDVISLSGVPLVYGQDAPETGETQEVTAGL
jgi:hypothetical protein